MPAVAACLLHVVIAMVFVGGWFQVAQKTKMVEPNKVVKASLVTLKKPKPKVVKRKTLPKAKPKPKPKPQPKVEKKNTQAAPKKPKAAPIENISNQQLLDELLAAEDDALEQAASAQQQQKEASEVAQYAAAMRALITSNWSRPPSARNDMEVVLEIQLVPTGDVINVQVVKTSGNTALDRSAIAAVEKVGRFTLLQGMPTSMFEANFRRAVLRFKPSDLRM